MNLWTFLRNVLRSFWPWPALLHSQPSYPLIHMIHIRSFSLQILLFFFCFVCFVVVLDHLRWTKAAWHKKITKQKTKKQHHPKHPTWWLILCYYCFACGFCCCILLHFFFGNFFGKYFLDCKFWIWLYYVNWFGDEDL